MIVFFIAFVVLGFGMLFYAVLAVILFVILARSMAAATILAESASL